MVDIFPPSRDFPIGNAHSLYSERPGSNEKSQSHSEGFNNTYQQLFEGQWSTDSVNHSSLHTSTEPRTEKIVQRSQNECFGVYPCQGQGFDANGEPQTDRYQHQRLSMRMGNFLNDIEPIPNVYANWFSKQGFSGEGGMKGV